jgi:hypothetical protein
MSAARLRREKRTPAELDSFIKRARRRVVSDGSDGSDAAAGTRSSFCGFT